jgi:hypothetical protein
MKKILSVIVVAALAWVAVHRVEVALEARELVDMAKAASASATADDLREARAAAAAAKVAYDVAEAYAARSAADDVWTAARAAEAAAAERARAALRNANAAKEQRFADLIVFYPNMNLERDLLQRLRHQHRRRRRPRRRRHRRPCHRCRGLRHRRRPSPKPNDAERLGSTFRRPLDLGTLAPPCRRPQTSRHHDGSMPRERPTTRR